MHTTPNSAIEVNKNRFPVDEILRIANADAVKAYGPNLADLSIKICLMDDGWHVDFEIVDEEINGGSPHYIICPETGEITWKTYEQ
jgi:hypothetical protein